MAEKRTYLQIDESGVIASIAFSDGTTSQAVVTKSQALETCKAMLGLKIDERELSALMLQITHSPLRTADPTLDLVCNEMQNEIQDLKRRLDFLEKERNHGDNEGEEWKRE